MKYIASIFLLLLGLVAGPAYALSEPVSSAPPSQQCTSDPAIAEVTISDLLQQLDKYQLHNVCLRGFVIHQFEHHAVYANPETTRCVRDYGSVILPRPLIKRCAGPMMKRPS